MDTPRRCTRACPAESPKKSVRDIAQDTRLPLQGGRLAKQVSLTEFDSELQQTLTLRFGLERFGDDHDPQVTGHGRDATDQSIVASHVLLVGNELTIELDDLRVQPEDVPHIDFPGTHIVDSQ